MKITTTIAIFMVITNLAHSQCTGGTFGGTINPTNSFQTTTVTSGNYYTFTTLGCEEFTFTFCNNGGSASFDTQISLLDNTGNPVAGGYNDDNCGLRSEVNTPVLSPGTYRVYITNYYCNNGGQSGTLAYNKSSSAVYGGMLNGYNLYGDASSITVNGTDCIQITPAQNNQTSCVWSDTTVHFGYDFLFETDIYFGNNASGADGATITFKNGSSCNCSTGGGQLGVLNMQGVVLEIDTYNNGSTNGDIPVDHLAISIDGDLQNNNSVAGPIAAIASGATIKDGNTHTVRIEWDAGTTTMEVYFDNQLRLTCVNDFVNTALGGDPITTAGLTGGTGGLNNQQYFCPSSTTILPVEYTELKVNCVSDGVLINWTTTSELNNKSFKIEKTTDGMLYQTIGEVEGAGNSNSLKNYSFKYRTDNNSKKTYYRIAQIDFDGKKNYSHLIGSSCENDEVWYRLIKNRKLLLSNNKTLKGGTLKIIGIDGKKIIEFSIQQNEDNSFDLSNYNSGVYIVYLTKNNGEIKRDKIYIH
ncbi:MAG: lectin-like domain-containing protein [Lishizhenia sp.]